MGTMQELVANVDHLRFDAEVAFETQAGAQLLPFHGMDKTGMAVCVYHDWRTDTGCDKGSLCPYRHIVGEKSVVCKHWLRGLCKKGDNCEFLHEYDLNKMPECYFFSKYNACNNKECPFRHVDPESRIKDCPWYERGFCRHGPYCKGRHRRRVMCIAYLCGMCVDGPACKHAHPRFDPPSLQMQGRDDAGAGPMRMGARPMRDFSNIVCRNCHQKGHKASHCPKSSSNAPQDVLGQLGFGQMSGGMGRGQRSIAHITCFQCGNKGHYANTCPQLTGGRQQPPAQQPPQQQEQQQQQQQAHSPTRLVSTVRIGVPGSQSGHGHMMR